jgi:hypothetical protein
MRLVVKLLGVVRRTYCLVPLEQYHAAALIARREVVARLVELNRGDNVRCCRSQRRAFTLPVA